MDKVKDKVLTMIQIVILNSLRNDIYKTFKKGALKIYALIEKLKVNPNQGKVLGHVGSMSIRELRYTSFRFYYILDGNKLRLFNQSKIRELLIQFIAMSKKNDQQKTIREIYELIERVDGKQKG